MLPSENNSSMCRVVSIVCWANNIKRFFQELVTLNNIFGQWLDNVALRKRIQYDKY